MLSESFRKHFCFSRDDWIRTSDPLHPMQVRYQAALRPAFRGANLNFSEEFPRNNPYNIVFF